MFKKYYLPWVAGIIAIFFTLQVKANPIEMIDDSIITTEVKTKFVNDPLLTCTDIHVDTQKGVVFLQGKVKSRAEAHTAIELAVSTSGVRDVNASQFRIEGSDYPIRDAITTAKVKGIFAREKIFGNKSIPVSLIHVETTDGIVYLTGKVLNNAQKKTVEKLAESVKSVRVVKSNITVEEFEENNNEGQGMCTKKL